MKSKRRQAQRWVDAAIRDVLLQKCLEEAPADIGGRCLAPLEGKVKWRWIAAAGEELIVAVPQELRCAGVRCREQSQDARISRQRSLLHNLAQIGIAAKEFMAIDASESARVDHYCSCESAEVGRCGPLIRWLA